MIHKAWCSIEEVPYYFSRSYIKYQGHTGWKINDLDQIWARLLGWSQLSNPSDLPCWLGIWYESIVWVIMGRWGLFSECRCFSCSSYYWQKAKVKGHGHRAQKKFCLSLALLDCKSSLNSQMGMERCTKLQVAQKRCTVVFQGHLSNFKVQSHMRQKNCWFLPQLGIFWL